jgi:hypothetical protein
MVNIIKTVLSVCGGTVVRIFARSENNSSIFYCENLQKRTAVVNG